MAYKIGEIEDFSACLKEIHPNDKLKSTYNGIYIFLNVFYIFIFKLM